MKFNVRYFGNNVNIIETVDASSIDDIFSQLFGKSYNTYHIIDMVIDCYKIALELRVVTTVAVIDSIVDFEIEEENND